MAHDIILLLPEIMLITFPKNNDMNSNANTKADFSSNYVQHLLSSQTHDYIHSSPVWSTHSFLDGGKHRKKHNYNKSPETHEADAMLTELYLFVAKVLESDKSTTVTIENPKRWMRKGNIMVRFVSTYIDFPEDDGLCNILSRAVMMINNFEQKELFEGKLGFKIFGINCELLLCWTSLFYCQTISFCSK